MRFSPHGRQRLNCLCCGADMRSRLWEPAAWPKEVRIVSTRRHCAAIRITLTHAHSQGLVRTAFVLRWCTLLPLPCVSQVHPWSMAPYFAEDLGDEGKTLPLPCGFTAFVAKTLPSPCVFTAFAAKTRPLHCAYTVFLVLKTVPFLAVLQRRSPRWTPARGTPTRWWVVAPHMHASCHVRHRSETETESSSPVLPSPAVL